MMRFVAFGRAHAAIAVKTVVGPALNRALGHEFDFYVAGILRDRGGRSRNVDPRHYGPLPWVTIFLMVVLDEGKSVSAYARALGIKDRRVVSRYLRDIGERARNGGPGLGLVTVKQHPKHSSVRRVVLTAKGRAVAKAILQQMRRPVDERRPVQCENCK